MNGLTKNQIREASLKITFLIILAFHAPILRAQVNVKDGSLTFSDKDIEDNSLPFTLRRTYNSRSLHLGVFGLGWCSPLDRDLDVTTQGRIGWLDCDSHRKIWFFKVPNTQTFASPLFPKTTIHQTQENYVLSTGNETQQMIFTSQGRLLEIKQKTKIWKVSYHQDKIRSLASDSKNRYTFFYNSQGFIEALVSPTSTKITYGYDNLLLTKVLTQDRLEKRPLYTYNYDGLKNLTQAFADSRLIWNVTYLSGEDRVLQIKNEKGCAQTYSYRVEPGPGRVDAFVDKSSSCSPSDTQYAFHYRQNKESEFILKTSRIVNKTSQTRIDFDSETGKITNVVETERLGKPIKKIQVERLPSLQNSSDIDLN